MMLYIRITCDHVLFKLGRGLGERERKREMTGESERERKRESKRESLLGVNVQVHMGKYDLAINPARA